jgi:hypothetical protein
MKNNECNTRYKTVENKLLLNITKEKTVLFTNNKLFIGKLKTN